MVIAVFVNAFLAGKEIPAVVVVDESLMAEEVLATSPGGVTILTHPGITGVKLLPLCVNEEGLSLDVGNAH